MSKLIYAPETKNQIKEVLPIFYEGGKEGSGQAFLEELESAVEGLSQSLFRQ